MFKLSQKTRRRMLEEAGSDISRLPWYLCHHAVPGAKRLGAIIDHAVLSPA